MSNKRLNVVVAGATGYVGLDLVLYLSKHPNVKITNLCAQKNIGKKINFIDKRIKKKLPKITNLKSVKWNVVDILFLSLPNGKAQIIISKLYKKYKKIGFIDLSADFRLTNEKQYKKWYKLSHKAKDLIKDSIYSIPEFKKKDIKKYRIISNPGCYPTSIQLPLIPLINNNLIKNDNIIIDSKSGYSGAGKTFSKKFNEKNLFSSTLAYSVSKHRHMAEIDQEIKKLTKKNISYSFNPHVVSTYRGILSSIYLEMKKNVDINTIRSALKKFYKNSKFVKIKRLNEPIGSGHVLNTNNCSISICKTRLKRKFVIFSVIDNLGKGASGQAIQNMNILCGFKEDSGLR